jgi:hypothetical protein
VRLECLTGQDRGGPRPSPNRPPPSATTALGNERGTSSTEGCWARKFVCGCELPVRAEARLGTVTLPLPIAKGQLVLSKLAYLTLCRSIQVLVLLVRGDAAKDLEILVLRQPACRPPSPDSTSEAGAGGSGPARRGQPRAAAVPLVVLLREARHVAWLAPAAGRRRVDLPAPPDWPATAGPGGPTTDRSAGQGESPVGLPAHQGRTPAAWHARVGDRDPFDASPSRARAGTQAGKQHLASVPAPANRPDRGVRLLHHRDGLAQAVVCAVLHRIGHPPSSPCRGDRQPQRRLVTQ